METTGISWKRAAGLAALGVYGPFVVMAVCTLLFVSCDHCKKTVWLLLPSGPGLIPLEAARSWLSFPRPDGLPLFLLAFLIGLSMVAALVWLIRLGRRSHQVSLTLALIISSLSAYGLMGAIRS
jgi:hypothetical protein